MQVKLYWHMTYYDVLRTEKSLTRLTGNIPLNNASAVTQAVICFSCIKVHLFLCVCVSRRLVVTSLRSQMRWSWLASPSWASPDSISLAQQRERERTPLLHSNSHLLLPFRLSFPPRITCPLPWMFAPVQSNTALLFKHTQTHTRPRSQTLYAFHQNIQQPFPRIQSRSPSSQEAIASETKRFFILFIIIIIIIVVVVSSYHIAIIKKAFYFTQE